MTSKLKVPTMRHGSNLDPPNRFESVHREADSEYLDWEVQQGDPAVPKRRIEYHEDATQSVVTENESPDIPFRYSLNPYRGCAHGCAYCYARPTHEYLGMNAGLDFETKIIVKRDAPQLLRTFLAKKSWKPEPIVFSGVTDCYQPVERELELTRGCLQVAWECRQPIGIVTKNALITRDLDILGPMAENGLIRVFVSITTLDSELARDLEPRTSVPAARLRAIETLSQAGVPVGVMLAPIIPGLNDSEIPRLLEAAKQTGARSAGYTLLRLPLTVEPVFREWLDRTRPLQSEKILTRIRATRDGELNRSIWGERMSGSGVIADQIRDLFRVFRRKFEMHHPMPAYNRELFRPPEERSGQQWLF